MMRCEDDADEHGSIEVETLVCETDPECVVGPDDRVAHDVVVRNYKRNKAYLDIEVRSSERRVAYERGDDGGEPRAAVREAIVTPCNRRDRDPGRRRERFWLRRHPDSTPGNDVLEVEVRYALLPDSDEKNTSVPETLPEVEVR